MIRKKTSKKRNDSIANEIEIEEIHHHPVNTMCDCCLSEMIEVSSTVAPEKAKFIPANIKVNFFVGIRMPSPLKDTSIVLEVPCG